MAVRYLSLGISRLKLLTHRNQTNLDPQKCPAVVLSHRHPFRPDRWCSSLGELPGTCYSTMQIVSRASLKASSQVQEIVIDYTNCPTEALNTTFNIPSSYVSATWKAQSSEQNYWWKSWNSSSNNWVCHLSFDIPESMGPPVFMYYRLTNFYQNHRRYVQSLDLEQLKGEAVPNSTIAGGVCSPLATDSATGKAYYPCGLIANSIFNDTIGSPVLKGESDSPYEMTKKGIAWQSDKALIQKSHYNRWQVVPPPNWDDYNYEKQGIPDLHEDEDFMVWMRTAGLPSFSKLSRRNDTTAMRPGRYQLDINYSMSRPCNCFFGGWKRVNLKSRVQRYGVRGHQVDPDLYTDGSWWQEPFHGYRLRCRWRSLCPPGSFIHDCLPGSASVRPMLPSISVHRN